LKRHQQLPDWATARVTRLRIECDEQVPYQVDGDPGGMLPVEVEVLPARLCLLVPPRAELS
jgi:diacylglycerol kinase family enzyme